MEGGHDNLGEAYKVHLTIDLLSRVIFLTTSKFQILLVVRTRSLSMIFTETFTAGMVERAITIVAFTGVLEKKT